MTLRIEHPGYVLYSQKIVEAMLINLDYGAFLGTCLAQHISGEVPNTNRSRRLAEIKAFKKRLQRVRSKFRFSVLEHMDFSIITELDKNQMPRTVVTFVMEGE